MLAIIRTDSWKLISCSQQRAAAWRQAEKLTAETGIPHTVCRL